MVNIFLLRPFLFTDILWVFMENMIPLRVKKHCKNYKKRSKLGSVGTSKLNNA
jgi:hypothetical protein